MRLLARLPTQVLIESSMSFLMKGSMLLLIEIGMPFLTCLLVGLFDVPSAPITSDPPIPDFDPLLYPPQKKIDLPLKIDSLNYLFLLEI